jgi:hypothetical protein
MTTQPTSVIEEGYRKGKRYGHYVQAVIDPATGQATGEFIISCFMLEPPHNLQGYLEQGRFSGHKLVVVKPKLCVWRDAGDAARYLQSIGNLP